WLAYEVLPEHWGQGFAREGCRGMIAWLIDELDVRHLAAEIDSLNAASLRLLERLGFQRMSLREAADHFKGRASDEWTLRLDAASFVRDPAASQRPSTTGPR